MVIYNYYKEIYKYELEKNDIYILNKVPDVSEYLDMEKLITLIKFCIPQLDEDEN